MRSRGGQTVFKRRGPRLATVTPPTRWSSARAGEVIGGAESGDVLLTEMDNDTLLKFVQLDLRTTADG